MFDVRIRHCRQRAAQLLARAFIAVLKSLERAPVLREKRRRADPVGQGPQQSERVAVFNVAVTSHASYARTGTCSFWLTRFASVAATTCTFPTSCSAST